VLPSQLEEDSVGTEEWPRSTQSQIDLPQFHLYFSLLRRLISAFSHYIADDVCMRWIGDDQIHPAWGISAVGFPDTSQSNSRFKNTPVRDLSTWVDDGVVREPGSHIAGVAERKNWPGFLRHGTQGTSTQYSKMAGLDSPD